jgi:hypothetical protein
MKLAPASNEKIREPIILAADITIKLFTTVINNSDTVS